MPGAAAQDSAGGWSWSSPSPSESSRHYQSHPTLGPAGQWCEGRSTRLAQPPLLVLQDWAVPSPGPSSQGHGAVTPICASRCPKPHRTPCHSPMGAIHTFTEGKWRERALPRQDGAGSSERWLELTAGHCRGFAISFILQTLCTNSPGCVQTPRSQVSTALEPLDPRAQEQMPALSEAHPTHSVPSGA